MSIHKLPTITSSKAKNLGNKVAEMLAKDLFSGVYNPGDMLPKETELADNLSVSRASVAGGLLILAALGMVSRQAGRGTVVEETREWNFLDPLVSRWMVDYADPNASFMKEIIDYRYGIEPYVSALAATRATAQDLASIEAAFNKMEQQVKNENRAEFSLADIEFHAAIYRATHNVIWAQSANILQPAIHLVIRETNRTADELNDTLGRHHQVLEFIRLRQPAEAFDAAIHVLDRSAHDLGIDRSTSSQELVLMMKSITPAKHDK